jgi:hypothetical protein
MKKSIILTLLSLLSWCVAFSQGPDHIDIIEKSVTLKSDLEGKSQYEKMFWGYTNSPVEFFAAGIRAQGGLRLYKTWPERRWKVEVIPFQDYWMEMHEWERLPVAAKRNKGKYTATIHRTTIAITDSLGDLLREKIRAMIDGYKAKPNMGDDGAIYGFRCIVGSEVWSLLIYIPVGKAEQMSNLYAGIIMDVSTKGGIDEEKYISELEKLEF